MKKLTLILAIQFLFIGAIYSQSSFSSGYGWKVPRKSPQAKTSQVLGITNIEVNYSRPSANARELWGNDKIIPLNKVWRVGANEATTIEFSTDVIIDTINVKKGKYALFLIPNSLNECTLILNSKHNQWGAFTYDKEYDVARVNLALENVPHHETLLLAFPKVETNHTFLSINWGNKSASLPIQVDLDRTVKESTNKTFDWQAGFFAAQYYFGEANDYKQALKWINASIAIDENVSNLRYKTVIYERMEDWQNAIDTGNKLLELIAGKKDSRSKYFYDQMIASIELWKKELK